MKVDRDDLSGYKYLVMTQLVTAILPFSIFHMIPTIAETDEEMSRIMQEDDSKDTENISDKA